MSLNALVSYGDSDDGGSGNESDQEKPSVKQTAPKQAQKKSFLAEADTFGGSLPKASSMLPSFKPDASGKVRIVVPKIEDDDDDGAPASKKPTLPSSSSESKPRCALFSVLPPPRVHSSMIPPSVTGRRRAIATEDVEWAAKSRPIAASKPPAEPAVVKPPPPPAPKQLVRDNSDSSDEEELGGNSGNFFSIGESSSVSVGKMSSAAVFDYGTEIGPSIPKNAQPASNKDNEFTGIFGPSKPSAQNFKHVRIDVVEGHDHHDHDHDDDYEEDYDDDNEATESGYREWLAAKQSTQVQEGGASSSSSIDLEELRKMQGRHNKGEAINIVECNADDLLDPAEYARQKAIEEAKASITGPNNMAAPRGRAKSRHQITYLAWLAKERETELKEFWSSSKMNKAQARMKYGF